MRPKQKTNKKKKKIRSIRNGYIVKLSVLFYFEQPFTETKRDEKIRLLRTNFWKYLIQIINLFNSFIKN